MEEIKKCPFCGGRAEVKPFTARKFIKCMTVYYVKCMVCGTQTALKFSISEAVEAWNRREE